MSRTSKYFRSFSSNIPGFIAGSVLFNLINIPMYIAAYFLANRFMPTLGGDLTVESMHKLMTGGGFLSNAAFSSPERVYMLFSALCAFVFVTSGLFCLTPFECGFNHFMRNVRRGNSNGFFSDFKTGIKNNLKQGFFSWFTDLIITALCLTGIFYFYNSSKVITIILTVVIIIFALVQSMVSQMIVSRQLKLSDMYKNAFIFFIMRPFSWALLAVLISLIIFIIPFVLLMTGTYAGIAAFVLIYGLLATALIRYIPAFFTGELLEQYQEVKKDA